MQIRQRWFLDEADARLSPRRDEHGEVHRASGAVRGRQRRDLLDRALEGRPPRGSRPARAADPGRRVPRPVRAADPVRAAKRRVRGGLTDQVALVLVAMVVGLSVEVTVSRRGARRRDARRLVDAAERLLEVDLRRGRLGRDSRAAAQAPEAAVLEDPLRRVVPRRGHHAAAGMRARAAEVEPVERSRVLRQLGRGRMNAIWSRPCSPGRSSRPGGRRCPRGPAAPVPRARARLPEGLGRTAPSSRCTCRRSARARPRARPPRPAVRTG